MRVLVACEFSGVVRDAFIARGHDAMSCDLRPSEKPGPHYQGDVFDLIDHPFALREWDMLIYHWPCTHMLLSGVRWMTTIPENKTPGILYGEERKAAMIRDAECFKRLLNCGIPKICGENPTMCGKAQVIIGTKWSQRIQPWEYGHGETKATYLWLKGLPLLRPTNIVPGREQRIHKMSPGPDRERERSRTYQGIADAMADQWGTLS